MRKSKRKKFECDDKCGWLLFADWNSKLGILTIGSGTENNNWKDFKGVIINKDELINFLSNCK